MKNNLFITIEGIEGAGKSTAMEAVRNYLETHQVPYMLTREPGGTEIAESIRKLLLTHYTEKMVEDAELLLLFASRAQHIATVIRPALEADKVVLSDRFTDASFAYQGCGRGIALDRIEILEEWVQRGLQPNLTILLDLPVEIGMKRARGRAAFDRIESEKKEFFKRVRQGYLDRAKLFPDRYRIVDATRSMEDVKNDLIKILDNFI